MRRTVAIFVVVVVTDNDKRGNWNYKVSFRQCPGEPQAGVTGKCLPHLKWVASICHDAIEDDARFVVISRKTEL